MPLPIISITKTLDSLSVGDVLVNESYGDEQTVLGVCGRVICLSRTNDAEAASNWWTVDELKKEGYKHKCQPEESTTELTLDQISEKFNIPLDKLRIKEK